ncbi:hypothetical protein HK407_01g00890 [Ordospora pajunii]|uniref:uncharacterized protein n=1 Tax=Ordospora pajunii TaxID=3039483 RepID=UPI0029527C58|nr:uncharacterized protein HK407_01g00890 [Ordospora pajunii]KAH9412196.1 hypothetical protein HK407_01g00890 [Ordospora pajunii]
MNRSRQELVTWMRSLGIDVCGIEDLGKGAAICQVLSILYEDFPHGFITKPREEHEYLRNMKICQEFFGMKSIKLYFPVDKLVKCKMQDNLEVAQWLCKHYLKVMGHDASRRAAADAAPRVAKEMGRMDRSCAAATVEENEELCTDNKESAREMCLDKADTGNGSKHTSECDASANRSLLGKHEEWKPDLNACDDQCKGKRIRELEEEVLRLKIELDDSKRDVYKKIEDDCIHNKAGGFDEDEIKGLLITFEKERDFYFKKLFTIEKYFLGRNDIDEGLKNDVFEILYEE